LGDVFVFEAFGAAHRPHSSIIGINHPQRLAGHIMNKEMSYYGKVLSDPNRPFLAIIGGAKVSDKILVLENMLDLVDELIIGGGMAYTFLKVLYNVEIGGSIFDAEGAKQVPKIMKKAADRGVKIHLPVDHIIGDKFSADAKVGVTDNEAGIPKGWIGLDAGPETRIQTSQVVARAKTVLWNGPLGVYEFGPFGGGTISAFWDLVAATRRGATTIIGGGDTGSASKFFYVGDHTVATGGGSSLVLMEGKLLPAVKTLSDISNFDLLPPPNEADEPQDDDDE
jgi:phosphoglycerate kinase